MIIDSKVLMFPPPPSYATATATQQSSDSRVTPTLATLPSHILLNVVYSTFPQAPSIDHGKVERQRHTLQWLVNSLRLVNRSFYIACMHLLRSTYLPAYQSLIRTPYTSDPFPTTTSHSRSPTYTASSSSSSTTSIQSIQRETLILDRFIALKVREDVFVDDSELHLEREDMFKDLFDHAQPKARLEDLMRRYGLREGVISVLGVGAQQQSPAANGSGSAKPSPTQSTSSLLNVNINTSNTQPTSPLSPLSPVRASPSSPRPSTSSRFFNFFSSSSTSASNKFISSSTPQKLTPTPYPPSPTTAPPEPKITPIPFSRISISLAPRTISLVVGSGTNRRILVQVQREKDAKGRDMKLEAGAKLVVNELKDLLISEAAE